MNAQPNTVAMNKALILSGLSPELATLTDSSSTGDFYRLSRAAGCTPGQVAELAQHL